MKTDDEAFKKHCEMVADLGEQVSVLLKDAPYSVRANVYTSLLGVDLAFWSDGDAELTERRVDFSNDCVQKQAAITMAQIISAKAWGLVPSHPSDGLTSTRAWVPANEVFKNETKQ